MLNALPKSLRVSIEQTPKLFYGLLKTPFKGASTGLAVFVYAPIMISGSQKVPNSVRKIECHIVRRRFLCFGHRRQLILFPTGPHHVVVGCDPNPTIVVRSGPGMKHVKWSSPTDQCSALSSKHIEAGASITAYLTAQVEGHVLDSLVDWRLVVRVRGLHGRRRAVCSMGVSQQPPVSAPIPLSPAQADCG